jgi:hypothetical protein
MSPDTRRLFYVLRAALIQALNAVEDMLGLPRSVASREDRRRGERVNGL